MNWRQKLIDETYHGDTARFEADWADAVLEGRLHTVNWNDLVVDATVLSDLKETGRELIENHLGYLPADSTILPYEPYLRALIQHHRQNQINGSNFNQQIEEHMKLIRNDDMKYNVCSTYDEAIYLNYQKTYLPYGQAVKERLTRFLGYAPKLEHSLIAELWMRDVMANDRIELSKTITAVDWKAITLIKYREVLLQQGQAAADTSPLPRLTV